MKKLLIILAVFLIGGASVYVLKRPSQQLPTNSSAPAAIKFPDAGSEAKDFTLEDLATGQKVSLSDFRGKKAVFLNLWASWCPFCVNELPDMVKIQKAFPDSVEILAVNRGEDKSTATDFAKKVGAYGTFPLLLDPGDSVWSVYRGFAMPTSFFIDKNGIIRDSKFGPLDEAGMREKLKSITP